MRFCSNCFQMKALSEFYPKRPNGYQSRCKGCNAEVVRGYNHRLKARRLAEGWRSVDRKRTKGVA